MRHAVALLAAAICLAGCGLGSGEEREGGVELRITRDFGHELLDSASTGTTREDDTVMRLLRREAEIETRYGGRFVEAIEGLDSGGPAGTDDWFFWVNGIESSVGAAEFELSPGDRVQWDFRDWEATMRVPAIVGAFPEPFVSGFEGERRPVRVECEEEKSTACETVKRKLDEVGVAASGSALGASGGQSVFRVVVGRWPAIRIVQQLATIEDGPEGSGVFARFAADGKELELLGEDGHAARSAPRGTGLIAATGGSDDEVVWAVTGIDDQGIERAALSLDERVLEDAFAVALTADGPEKLPVAE